MSDCDTLITNRAALDEALLIHPFDEESQVELLLDFIAQFDLDDEFQAFVLRVAQEQKALHDANEKPFGVMHCSYCAAPRVAGRECPECNNAYVHAIDCDLDEDCTGCAPPTACGDPKCPGWGHFESDTYGFEIETCDTCVDAGLHDYLFETDTYGERYVAEEKLLALHAKTCDCNMGIAKCPPKTRGVPTEHCYASKAEQAADFARRDAIAMKLKEEGRL